MIKSKTLYKISALVIWLLIIWYIFFVYCIFTGKMIKMLVIFLIIIMTMFFYTIIKLRKRDIYKEYEKGQYLENWYSNSVKENGFKWIKRAGEELKKMYGKNIKILSIAANKGTYEKELYKL